MMNPYLTVIRDMGLTRESQGPAGTLHLLCSVAGALYADSFSGNPYSEVKRLLVASAGRSLGYQEVEVLLTSGETRWNSRR